MPSTGVEVNPLPIQSDAMAVAPASVGCRPFEVNAPASTADNATFNEPEADITFGPAKKIVSRTGRYGTNIGVMLKYDAAITALGTAPVVAVFGRMRPDEDWVRLFTVDGESPTATLTPDFTNDVTNGSFRYTGVKKAQIFDTLGMQEFIVGIQTAAASNTGGTLDTSAICIIVF